MKKRIFSSILIFSILISSIIYWSPQQSAKENNAVADLALMLPESDIILAIDMDKTLNVVGPNLLNQDAKKIENLKKLMRSLENVIGISPYEINQIVAGVKLPSVEEKNFLEKLDFTVIFRTANANDVLLEKWSKKMDAIEAFEQEREPSEVYLDAFKSFRYYKLSENDLKKVDKLNKEFAEIVKKMGEVNQLLSELPASVKASKDFKDSLKRNKNTVDSIIRFQNFLKMDADAKTLNETSIKLQNRWYEVGMEDAKRGEKLAAILKEAKEIYPNYKMKTENAAKIDTLINISNYEFYDKLAKKNFGLPDVGDNFEKDPNEMMKEKLAEVVKHLNNFPTAPAKQTAQFRVVSKTLQKLENSMNVWLKMGDDSQKFETLASNDGTHNKTSRNLSKSIKENAKISDVNGKRLITIDLEKINFWGSGLETSEAQPPVAETSKTETKDVVATVPDKLETLKDKGDENSKEKEEKKKENFAIGYLDDKTMVLGFESGIRSLLSRKEDYKNPKAAEMLNSFKNPLISFATNSKIFQNFAKAFETPTQKKEEKKEEKKQTPTDKFFNDINIFGSLEYDGDSAAANDLIMSLGFTKNQVEDVFSIEADEESSVFEVGDYQISKAIFYDLLNTLKAFKASVSFKFEKKKIAALLESAPQIIEDARFKKTKNTSQIKPKTKVQNVQSIEEILTSPKFYIDLVGILAKKK
jgi:hypothetical protein